MNATGKFSEVTNDAFREIFQSMSEGIIMVDKSGAIRIANPVTETLFGYPNDELIGQKPENLLPTMYRGAPVSFRKSFNADPHPRRMVFGRNLEVLRKDNSGHRPGPQHHEMLC